MFSIPISIVDNMKENKKKILIIEKKQKNSYNLLSYSLHETCVPFFAVSIFDIAYFRKQKGNGRLHSIIT